MKTCSKCKSEKDRSEFYLSTQTKDGLYGWCKLCHGRRSKERSSGWTEEERAVDRERKRRWLERNPGKQAGYTRKLRYGISELQYQEMMEAQMGFCGIGGCDRPIHSVDHDHSCCPGQKTCGKCVRALLCRECNVMLGLAQDDPQRLRNAAEYLEEMTRLKDLHLS